MPGITSLLDIGKKSLLANQAAIQVVGNNIANANTPGYSRQAVRFEDGLYINSVPGQLGTGVNAAEVIRYFDEFIEAQFNSQSSEESRWTTLYNNLRSVEGILNESNSSGINAALAEFWADWQDLSVDPQNNSVRTVLLSRATSLESIIESTGNSLRTLQSTTDDFIAQEVDSINEILTSITRINSLISINEVTGKNNANGLRDERATLVRQLAEKMDINYIDNGLGNVTITTKAGHTLVDGVHAFRLGFEKTTEALKSLATGSAYTGNVRFDGPGNYEYTIEIVQGGAVATSAPPDPATTASFRVSVDGGRTWLKDTNGNELRFFASDQANKVTLPDGSLSIYFDDDTPNDLSVGDRFQILPNKSLFWYETSSSKVNITPQILPNGEDNTRRLTGGVLAGYFHFRDNSIGGYLEKLDAFASGLAWEVNRIHSQGAGSMRFDEVVGTYKTGNTLAALSDPASGLTFGHKLESGNIVVHVYDKTTGALKASRNLDLDPLAAGVQNFDPTQHSLEDVRAAFTAMGLSAQIIDGRLQLNAQSGEEFAFGSDSSGLLAALGINTFFDGNDARSLAVNAKVLNNTGHINAGHVNGAGEMNSGDNTTAVAIAGLQSKRVSITTISGGTTTQTLGEYYSALVSRAGSDTAGAKFSSQYHGALAADLRARQDAVSGVNLDEEMTSLIKFQHSYTAAAKLITTAESMLQVLLGLKS
jgi:flagellar hook-associated protein 1 FlgK